MADTLDIHKMKIQELRDYAAKNKLTVVGTGKDGNPIRKDLVKAVTDHYNRMRRQKESEVSAMVRADLDRPEFYIGWYDKEYKGMYMSLVRVMIEILTKTQNGDITVEVRDQVIEKYTDLLLECKKLGINTETLELHMDRFNRLEFLDKDTNENIVS
jgi:hypothetical protein